MGQSLVQNYIHIIFSTKNRMTYLKQHRQADVFNYIGGLCNKKGCQVLRVGGYEDHIHILCMLAKDVTLIDLLRFIKTNSSRWIKIKYPELESFSWQEGYGAFSINPQQIETVIEYIEKQNEHHRNISFQDEFMHFLKKYKTDFDDKYIWK